ncbi:hypothetical protein Lser_V15G38631 [Lactuca serriola]
MRALEVPEHGHPLKLIDLHREYKEEEEEEDDDDDEGGDPITKIEGFGGATCGRCREEIHIYHRYYYTCTICDDFSLHKFCAELPSTLEHLSHPSYPLRLVPFPYSYVDSFPRICNICKRNHQSTELRYKCHNRCDFSIDVKCALEVGKNIIYHPCHPHLLICAIPKPILCECSACGKEHKGVFYQCTTCGGFTIHNDCAFLPEKLLIQERTDGAFHHTHPLTISYSFPLIDQDAKHRPRCRVCGDDFRGTQNLWIYKCDRCLYYAHLDCVRVPPPTAGFGKTIKNYEDVDHPGLLHLPFPDETYSLPKHYLFFQQSSIDHHHNKIKVDDHLTHDNHQHPLILVDGEIQIDIDGQTPSNISFSLSMCHNPMKKTQLLCNGCLRPITDTMRFYVCAQQSCNDFALHEWCTRLPPKIENHPSHPQHTLHLLYSNDLPRYFGVFYCDVCRLPCNGFSYHCVECVYCVDVTCGFIPREITHEAHPNHILSLSQNKNTSALCLMCLQRLSLGRFSFYCNTCSLCIHLECALLLPETIRHKYDKKHPMHLSYLPIENHKSEYFCEICEKDLNPHASFYHCKDCVQSIHTECASLILQCETETYVVHTACPGGTHSYVNIKFGGIYNTSRHEHPILFAQGIISDGQCSTCGMRLQYNMIFKCLECKFAVNYECGLPFY